MRIKVYKGVAVSIVFMNVIVRQQSGKDTIENCKHNPTNFYISILILLEMAQQRTEQTACSVKITEDRAALHNDCESRQLSVVRVKH